MDISKSFIDKRQAVTAAYSSIVLDQAENLETDLERFTITEEAVATT